MLLRLFAFGALVVSSVTAAGVSRAVAYPPLNPVLLGERAPSAMLDPTFAARALQEARTTNAERLRRGLPLKAPHRRQHNLGRTETSAVPLVTKTGVLQMRDSGNIMGYVSKTTNPYGEYGSPQPEEKALHISFSYDPTKSIEQLDFIGTDSSIYSTFPLVGLVNGFASTSSNLGSSSSNYVYVAGVSLTGKGSTPVTQANSFSAQTGNPETVESAVWSVDLATGKVTAQWINTDGSVPTAYVCYTASSDAILLTGDVALFSSSFGQVTQIDLYFVEDA